MSHSLLRQRLEYHGDVYTLNHSNSSKKQVIFPIILHCVSYNVSSIKSSFLRRKLEYHGGFFYFKLL